MQWGILDLDLDLPTTTELHAKPLNDLQVHRRYHWQVSQALPPPSCTDESPNLAH